jgi:REP element-mobilizing transposase RayT
MSVVNSPHSRNLRLYRFGDGPETFFVTKSLHPKKPALNESAREIVVSALHFALEAERIYLGAFVVMPDHLHLLIALIEPWTLPRFMHATMSFVAAKTQRQLHVNGTQWQDGYYDTLIRTGNSSPMLPPTSSKTRWQKDWSNDRSSGRRAVHIDST